MDLLRGIVSVLIFVLVSGCQSSKTGKESPLSQNETKGDIQGQISISGAYALFPLILKMSEDFMVLHPAGQD